MRDLTPQERRPEGAAFFVCGAAGIFPAIQIAHATRAVALHNGRLRRNGARVAPCRALSQANEKRRPRGSGVLMIRMAQRL